MVSQNSSKSWKLTLNCITLQDEWFHESKLFAISQKFLLAICLSHYFFLRKDKFWELSPHVPFNYWCLDFSNCRKIIIELSVSSMFCHSHQASVLQSDGHITKKNLCLLRVIIPCFNFYSAITTVPTANSSLIL